MQSQCSKSSKSFRKQKQPLVQWQTLQNYFRITQYLPFSTHLNAPYSQALSQEVKKIEIKSYEDVFHDNLAAAKSSKEALAKAEFQAFKAKTNVLVPAYDARKAFIKKIPKLYVIHASHPVKVLLMTILSLAGPLL